MKLRILFSAVLLTVSYTVSQAQLSGYMGKQFLIYGSASAMADVGRVLNLDPDNAYVNWQIEGANR